MSNIKVDEIYGQPIYFNNESEIFHVHVDSKGHTNENLAELKTEVMEHHKGTIDVDVLYNDGGEMVMVKIVHITPNSLMTNSHWERVPLYVHPTHVYPLTENNKSLMDKQKDLWNKASILQKQAYELSKHLEPFPNDYWSSLSTQTSSLVSTTKSKEGEGE